MLSRETEHDGDSIGADGPVHATRTPPGDSCRRFRCRAAGGTFVSPLRPEHLRCRIDTEGLDDPSGCAVLVLVEIGQQRTTVRGRRGEVFVQVNEHQLVR